MYKYLPFTYIWSKLLKKMKGAAIIRSEIHPLSKVEAGSDFVNSIMKKYSFCGYNCQIINTEIGAFCSLADNIIIGGARHPIEWASSSPVFYAGKDSISTKFSEFPRIPDKYTIIGNDVWIGTGVKIIQGVNIGTGAVIGAGAVITKDVPPYAIVGGNPAKIIRMRFEENVVKGLLESEWWNIPEERLQKAAQYIRDPKKFINEIMKQ